MGEPQAFDVSAALRQMDGDGDLLRAVIETFLKDLPGRMAALQEAEAGGNAELLGRTAHLLRGSALVFGADETRAAASEVERLAKIGDLRSAEAAAGDLRGAIARLKEALRDYIKAD